MQKSSATEPNGITRWQFLISERGTPLQPGLADVSTARFAVNVHPLWPVVRIVDDSGEQVAVLFGTAIDHQHDTVWKGTVTWTWEKDADLHQAFESFLYGLSGSWVCVADYRSLMAVYCDGATTISCLFSTERRMVAAAACQIFTDAELAKRQHLMSELFYGGDTFFVAGLTAYDGLSRLLINFRLNLSSWQPERIWQAGHGKMSGRDSKQCADFIAQRVKQSLAILVGDGSVAMTLTAGNESRMLLSLVQQLKDKIQFYTLDFPGAGMDVRCALELSRRFGLRHQLLRPVRRSKYEAAAWRKRTSYSVGGINAYFSSPAPKAKYAVNGLYGELARAFIHESTDTAFERLSAADILDRLRLPATDRNLAAAAWWLDTLWDHDRTAVLDAAQLELRYGCWASTQIVARDETSLWVAPLGDRAVLSAMVSLPLTVRKAGKLTAAIVLNNWPELLDMPVNQRSWRDRLREFSVKLFNIPIVVQKLHYEANGYWRRIRIKLGFLHKPHR